MYNSCTRSKRGALAQLGARIAGSDEVAGSSPVCSTIVKNEVSEREPFSCLKMPKTPLNKGLLALFAFWKSQFSENP